MIVQYSYITWSPPILTEEEQLELGRKIATIGRKQFEIEFRESIKKSWQKSNKPATGIASWPKGIRYTFLTLLYAGMFVALLLSGLIMLFIPLSVFLVGIYYASVFFAVRRFNEWTDSLMAKYAANVGRNHPPKIDQPPRINEWKEVNYDCTVEELSSIQGSGRRTIEALGIETAGGVFAPLINVGTLVPCSVSEVFSTGSDSQSELKISLFRGTDLRACKNHFLGRYQVVGIPPEPRGVPQIEVTFAIIDHRISIRARHVGQNSMLRILKSHESVAADLNSLKLN